MRSNTLVLYFVKGVDNEAGRGTTSVYYARVTAAQLDLELLTSTAAVNHQYNVCVRV